MISTVIKIGTRRRKIKWDNLAHIQKENQDKNFAVEVLSEIGVKVRILRGRGMKK
jgi:hypothetical protein